ncbi:recombinase family protein [Pontimicrobium aquaticum]|uniref:Recombinase family protein n=1 Tax=Pontimicrobium aquaticum TaxID=2565367 RepID=A0A4U0EVP3_9FLAO|nr:recombinase family protein [Pontimicrobium aquaticum]TJY35900.1 recombinase family protein [Pontimicrobium aquaticum]
MNARYNRISTITQNIERQVAKTQPNEQLYNDVISGSVPFADRPQGLKLIQDIKEDKIKYVTVSSIDRLGRNTLDILQTIELFNESGVNLRVDNLGIESMTKGKPNQVFKLIISVMSNVSEMEREAILERQREGISLAKLKGVYKGRVKGSKESKKEFLVKYKNVSRQLKKGKSLRDIAKLCDVSLGTVQKVKAYQDVS